MRRYALLAGACLALAAAWPARGQTADDIVAKYIAATGGAANWAALESLAVSTRSPYFSSDACWKKPNRVRIDSWSDVADLTDTRAFDGTSGWRLNSAEGASKPRTLSAQEIAELREEVDWMFELVDYKAKGYKIALQGTATVDAQSAYKLELTTTSGAVVQIFLDVKTGLEVQRVKRARSPEGGEIELVLPVGGYRVVGGLNLPTTVGPAARTYQVNGEIPDSRFEKPGMVSEADIAKRKVDAAVAALLPVGSLAPDWTLRDATGRLHRSSDLRGSIVVMDFWATWCVPCHRVMPEMQRLHEEFAARGVVVLGISTSERGGDPVQLMRDRGCTYTLLLHGESIAERFRVAGLPTVYVIGPDGRVLHADVGASEASGASRRAAIVQYLDRAVGRRPNLGAFNLADGRPSSVDGRSTPIVRFARHA